MLRKLAILALLVLGGGGGVCAQGTRKDDIVINSRGFPERCSGRERHYAGPPGREARLM